MRVAANAIAIDLGRRRLRALYGRRDGGILRVQRAVVEDVPEEIDPTDAQAYGRWVGRVLREHRFPRGRATISLAREHVVVKRLTLPSADQRELPDMARLSMQRELTFDAERAVIDFVPLLKEESSTTVLAVAVPDEILDHTLRVCKAAGIRVQRVALRALGSALLLQKLGEEVGGSILAVDVLGEGIEFCLIDQGRIRFSRAAESVPSADPDLLADTVLTETRRTWMSYRISEDSSAVRHVVVMGEKRVSEQVREPISEMLRVETEVLASHPLVDPGKQTMDRLWPLAGLLLEHEHGGETIDFAHPRKAPDTAAERRKRVIIGAGAAVLAVLGLWTVGNMQIRSLEEQVARLEEQRQSLLPEYQRFGRDRYKLEHIEQWASVRVDWLDHALHLVEMRSAIAGEPRKIVLDGFSGALTFRGVDFDRRARVWSAPMQVAIEIRGEAKDRAIADAFRDALVSSDLYATSSTGADAEGGRRLPYGFTYRLHTDAPSPPPDEEDGERLARALDSERDRVAHHGGAR